MNRAILTTIAMLFIAACGNDSAAVSGNDTAKTASPNGATNTSHTKNENPEHLDSLVRGYITDTYTIIDTFTRQNKVTQFNSKKNIVRKTYSFSEDKILYNTGVKTDEFTAVVAGFNTGTYVLDNAPMDGIVFRMITKDNYWHLQCDVANGYIHENCTVDVLFIRNTQIDSE